MQMSTVMAVGLAEGSSHVHWRKVRQILGWWFFGFFLVLCFSAALVAQGALSFYMVYLMQLLGVTALKSIASAFA